MVTGTSLFFYSFFFPFFLARASQGSEGGMTSAIGFPKRKMNSCPPVSESIVLPECRTLVSIRSFQIIFLFFIIHHSQQMIKSSDSSSSNYTLDNNTKVPHSWSAVRSTQASAPNISVNKPLIQQPTITDSLIYSSRRSQAPILALLQLLATLKTPHRGTIAFYQTSGNFLFYYYLYYYCYY